MNDKNYFVVAITIALIVPMIFGSMYFLRVRGIKENAQYVMLLTDSPDLIIDGDASIEVKRISNEKQVANFSVLYARGETGNVPYHIILDRSEESTDVSLSWELLKYDDSLEDYVSYASGSTDKGSSKKVDLNFSGMISPLETQKFKLYYFLDGNFDDSEIFKSNIILEQE